MLSFMVAGNRNMQGQRKTKARERFNIYGEHIQQQKNQNVNMEEYL